MARVVRGNTLLAESDQVVEVEGTLYFPIDSIRAELFEPIDQTTVCPWKGTASYYDIVVDDERVAGAAWSYPDPKDAASHIREHVAFYERDGISISV